MLPAIVHADHVGFIAGQQAPDAARRVLTLVGLCRTPSILLSLDAENAFDRVHWGYLKAVLPKFGFSGWILSALMSLYSNPSASVSVSGLKSKAFNIKNGTRQECPLSPIIFALMKESLATKIREPSESIPYLGIAIPKCTSSLFTLNYCTLLNRLSTDLPNLKSCAFSTVGRIAALKMLFLLKLLYLFHCPDSRSTEFRSQS